MIDRRQLLSSTMAAGFLALGDSAATVATLRPAAPSPVPRASEPDETNTGTGAGDPRPIGNRERDALPWGEAGCTGRTTSQSEPDS